ncbi:MAG: hypothetical protein ACLR0U_30125 [Enterocloster clostridioformis]
MPTVDLEKSSAFCGGDGVLVKDERTDGTCARDIPIQAGQAKMWS